LENNGDNDRLRIEGKAVDGPVSRYLNRRISRAMTMAILKFNVPITPNTISWISFLIAIIACIFIINKSLIIGGILVQLSSVIDGVDGELARARGLASRRGGFLDTMLDRYSDVAIFIGIAMYSIYYSTYNYAVIVVVTALSGDLLVSYLHSKGTELVGVHPSLIGPLNSLASRDVRLFIISLSLIFGVPIIGLILLSFATHLYIIIKSYYIYNRL